MRTSLSWTIALLLLVLVIVIGVATRYDVVPIASTVTSNAPDFYLLDRWSGHIWAVKDARFVDVTRAQPPPAGER